MADLKAITEDQRLQAFALFTMAIQHTREAAKFEKGLAAVLGLEGRLGDVGHFSDQIWGHAEPVTTAEFDKALRLSGFIVKADEDANG